MQRIITIIGPESTGKSEMTRFLTEKLNGVPVWEYARTYLSRLDRAYNQEDLWAIAEGQWLQEQQAIAGYPQDTLIIDTNLEVIKVWAENAYGYCPENILKKIAEMNTSLYLLMNIDMPWSPDPMREHPAPEQRSYFFNVYKDIVINSGIPFGVVSGIGEYRFKNALEIIQAHIF